MPQPDSDRGRPRQGAAPNVDSVDDNNSLLRGADYALDLSAAEFVGPGGGLRVPDVTGLDALAAALAYADAGWYVGPVKAGTKHPGSVLGNGWHRLTSREPDVIAAWFAGTSHGVFLHCGPSGAVVLDVDNPKHLPQTITQAIIECAPPWQSTRPNQPGRRHYLYAQPPGRDLGNSLGGLAGGWGEIRGRNGVIVVAPSVHPDGGEYAWGPPGDVPVLPATLADQLGDAPDAAEAATDEQVRTFLSGHVGNTRPELLQVHADAWSRKVADGESRHHEMTGPLAGAMKEARCGLYPAQVAADTLEGLFRAAVAVQGHGRQGAARSDAQARSEWRGLLSWAVAQAVAADPDAVRNRVAERVPDLSLPSYAGAPLSDEEDPLGAVRRRFPRLDLAALLAADRPQREWVIAGLVPAGASVSLVGPAGSGKSLLLLAGMISVARGEPTFAGLPVIPRKVLLVDMENTADDLADRFTALRITPDNADDLAELVLVHLPPLAMLDTPTGGMELAAILDAYNVQPGDVVVLDSLQRVIEGAENDSDTMRAFYRHTGRMLKLRGVTVIRTDNTGKDTEKGARGTSGKRDDVDVELLVTLDAEKAGRLYVKPGKVRIPGVERVLIDRHTGQDGGLSYTTAGDPFRAAVSDAVALLAELNVPVEAGERKAGQAIGDAGIKVSRSALRAALKERRTIPTLAPYQSKVGAPTISGAPLSESDPNDRAADHRRTNGAPGENAETLRENRADQQRRTNGAPNSHAPQTGAPLSSLSRERRTLARPSGRDLETTSPTPSGDLSNTSPADQPEPLPDPDDNPLDRLWKAGPPTCARCSQPLDGASVMVGAATCSDCEREELTG